MKKTIGIIGCGSIGRALTAFAGKELSGYIGKVLLWDTENESLASLCEDVELAEKAEGLEDIIEKSDLIVEAAGADVVAPFLKAIIASGKDAMIMSIGGLLGNESLLVEAEQKGIKVTLPTGAIAGIDAVKAAKIAGIEKVTLITRKPAKSLKGALYFDEKGIDVDIIEEETVVFEGSAREAMKHFPKNINVSALLSLAGIGPDRTTVKIVTSPEFSKNSHEITVEGAAGTLKMLSENVPSPDNPKTSYMAPLAAMAALKGYFSTVRLGT